MCVILSIHYVLKYYLEHVYGVNDSSIRLLGHQSKWPHSVVMLCTETSSLACLCCLPGSLWGRSDSSATRLANVCRIHVRKLIVVATGSAVVNSDDCLTRPLDTVKCLKMSVKDLCNRLHFGLYYNTQNTGINWRKTWWYWCQIGDISRRPFGVPCTENGFTTSLPLNATKLFYLHPYKTTDNIRWLYAGEIDPALVPFSGEPWFHISGWLILRITGTGLHKILC
jgi:hypothetical protein